MPDPAHPPPDPRLGRPSHSARAWLWISVGNDAVYFHIDPSRSAEAAQTLFGEFQSVTVLVCDRYSAYKMLARLLGGLVILRYFGSINAGTSSSA